MTSTVKTAITINTSALVDGTGADASDVTTPFTDTLNHVKSGRVAVSATDLNVKHLLDALTAGTGITLTLTNSGADETVTIAATASAGVPAGVLAPYAAATAPSGWLLCNGAAVSRTTYATLFAAISTSYGVGDGSTTFNLPDMRGRVPLGKDDMGGSSANRVTATQADNLGQGSGAETHTLVTGEMPAHTHSLIGIQLAGGGSTTTGDTVGTASSVQANVTGSAGSGTAHNNMQPYQTTTYIIKF